MKIFQGSQKNNKWLIIAISAILIALLLVVIGLVLPKNPPLKEGGLHVINMESKQDRITFNQAIIKLAPNNPDFGTNALSIISRSDMLKQLISILMGPQIIGYLA